MMTYMPDEAIYGTQAAGGRKAPSAPNGRRDRRNDSAQSTTRRRSSAVSSLIRCISTVSPSFAQRLYLAQPGRLSPRRRVLCLAQLVFILQLLCRRRISLLHRLLLNRINSSLATLLLDFFQEVVSRELQRITDRFLAELTSRKNLELFSIDKSTPWNRHLHSYVEVKLASLYRLSGLKDGDCPGMVGLQHEVKDWYQERLSKSSPFLLQMLNRTRTRARNALLAGSK